ncbi:MAG: hypothetical protein EOM91_20820 [Sphingobacteriia bacterium]|nr:hypothetical protein [Sphingobacteriia bacterium]
MGSINPTILREARDIAHAVIDRGDPPENVYSVPVGATFLYLSADPCKVLGPDAIRIGATVFYLGFRRSDLPAP